MNTFSTLLWLEARKYSNLALILLGAVALSYWLFGLITRGPGGRPEDNGAVLGLGMTFLIGGFVGTSFFYGAESQREFRAGRWPLLLGSPVSGWVQIGARLTFVFALLTLYTVAMVWMMDRFGFGPLGLEVPFGSYFSFWLYLLGGLPLMLAGLFLGMLSGAYLPSKLWVPASLVGALGAINLGGLLFDLLSPLAYTLPGWRITPPDFPADLTNDPDFQINLSNNALPTEVFVVLIALSVLLYVLSSRMWEEVEA